MAATAAGPSLNLRSNPTAQLSAEARPVVAWRGGSWGCLLLPAVVPGELRGPESGARIRSEPSGGDEHDGAITLETEPGVWGIVLCGAVLAIVGFVGQRKNLPQASGGLPSS
jgi:hypothetical protein